MPSIVVQPLPTILHRCLPLLPHLSLATVCCRSRFQPVFFTTAYHCSICLLVATHHRFMSPLPSPSVASSFIGHLCSSPPYHRRQPSLPSPFLLSLPAPSHVVVPLLHLPSAPNLYHPSR
ncbi:hypothetical protein BHE74_00035816 [Ensete ventricosum]|nr:hypothetical protein BHE74_00035816 [Ensete ventricosum]RZR80441.1 hypothetical protein BHM03_00006489 [Ensete ventricosum]